MSFGLQRETERVTQGTFLKQKDMMDDMVEAEGCALNICYDILLETRAGQGEWGYTH